MSILNSEYFRMAMAMVETMKLQQLEWQERIRKEWHNSKNYPRKKKKAVRKELLLEWNIACYDPFNF